MGHSYSKGRKDEDEEKLIKIMEGYFIAVGRGQHETAGFDRLCAFRKSSYFVEIKTESKLKSYYLNNGKRIPLTKQQSAIKLLTKNERNMRDWCLTHGLKYVIVYNKESIKREFGIK